MRSVFTALAIIACLSLPATSLATSYEDGLEDCSYPKMTDLLIIKPVGLVGLTAGTALYVFAAPWTLLTARKDFGTVTDTLVMEPAHFTFVRPLGQCPTNGRL